MNAMSPIGAISALSGIAGTSPTAAAGSIGSLGSVDSLGGASSIGATSAAGTAATGQAGAGSFLNSLGDAFGSLNTQLSGADAAMADFASGGSADLHTVLLQMQEASLGLKLGVQVRDKLLEAYQEIMRMQL